MKKIIVIGYPGSGKSTFSKALHEITKIPLIHLDMLYWDADKTTCEKTVFLEKLSKTLQGDEWIIDGNFASTMELRMSACDTVFSLTMRPRFALTAYVSVKESREVTFPGPKRKTTKSLLNL